MYIVQISMVVQTSPPYNSISTGAVHGWHCR